MASARLGLSVALVLALAGRTGAHADNAQQVDALFAEGRALLEKNDAAGACGRFQAAIALDPTAPGVMLNLGLCNERLAKYATSLYWFRKAQTAAAEAQLPEYEKAATDHTVALAAQVAILRVDVSGAPAEVEVRVDGRVIPPTEYARIEVDSTSQVEATAPEYFPFHQTLALATRDAGTLQIVLVSRSLGQGRRHLAYGLGAVGLLTLGGCLAYNLYEQNYYQNHQSQPNHDKVEQRIARYGTAMFVGGTALIAAAVVVYVTAPKYTPESSTRMALLPAISADQLGLALSGSF